MAFPGLGRALHGRNVVDTELNQNTHLLADLIGGESGQEGESLEELQV